MNLPNKITLLRICASPLFFVLFFLPDWVAFYTPWMTAAVWGLWGIIELSDIVDGVIARRCGLESSLGKLFDPFADVVSRLTFFLCFTVAGLIPAWIFIILLYRELGNTFLRILALSKGSTMGANRTGKMKAVFYSISAAFGLYLYTVETLFSHMLARRPSPQIQTIVLVLFAVTAAISVFSFGVYLYQFFSSERVRNEGG